MKIKALVLMGLTLYPTTGDYFMPDAVEYVATPTKKARYTNDVSGLTQYINTIAPKVPTKRARALAKIILDAARRRKVDPFIYAALIRHESAFAPGAMNCYKRKDGYMCDYGLPQINEVWLAELGLDANRLIEDEAYAIDTGARILARAKFQYGSDPKWYRAPSQEV